MEKKRELISYVFWGVASTLLNIGLAQGLVKAGIDYKISNAVTLVIVKVFCYFTNKIFVFRTPFGNIGTFLKEAVSFVFARWITFLVDYFGVILLVDGLKQQFFFSKCVLSVIVIILNYVLSKRMVFRKSEESGATNEKLQ